MYSQRLSSLVDSAQNSLKLSGSKSYQVDLLFYGAVKAATKTESIYLDLASRFPGSPVEKWV